MIIKKLSTLFIAFIATSAWAENTATCSLGSRMTEPCRWHVVIDNRSQHHLYYTFDSKRGHVWAVPREGIAYSNKKLFFNLGTYAHILRINEEVKGQVKMKNVCNIEMSVKTKHMILKMPKQVNGRCKVASKGSTLTVTVGK